ncbi:hypothetical protein [Raineya orbicola]|jgi:hypothetical protein|uniref:Uncharacterized protein n=1 Tax=Raineya orbicola TaxID=2016530 RepID=A0A2N3IAZ3_9BACT|nr:hypothetical protein [Raineya orbicola]PKQ67438.1 hypothetical protein Rain11_2051 [Raineya orbicola]
MGKHFIRTSHFRQRCQERQISETLLGMIERNLAQDIDFQLQKLLYEENKIIITPPFYFVPNTRTPHLIIVRNKKLFITAYWICTEKLIKIIQQEPYFYLNLDKPNENSPYIIL